MNPTVHWTGSISSIGELLLLIYKGGFYRWEQKQPLKDNHDPHSNHMSRICSRSLLIWCAIIVVFSTRIYQNLDLGRKRLLRYRTMELKSLRCIVRCLENVLRPMYILFSLETISQGIFEHIEDIYPIKKFSGWGRVIANNQIGSFKFVVVNDKTCFFC